MRKTTTQGRARQSAGSDRTRETSRKHAPVATNEESRFLDAVGRYLRSKGWNPLVAGPSAISYEEGMHH